MIEETPERVMGFLGAAMFSLALLFAVTVTDASFSGTAAPLPQGPFGPDAIVSMLKADPFGPDHLMATADNISSSYAKFLTAYLFEPEDRDVNQLAYDIQQNYNWVMDNADQQIVAMAGISDLLWQEPTPMAHPAHVRGQVAGAFTMHNLSQ
jgi:hypothetical protein